MKLARYSDEVYAVKYRMVSHCTVDEFYAFIEKDTGIAPERPDNVHDWNSLFEGMEVNGEVLCYMYLSPRHHDLRGLSHELIHAIVYVFECRCIPINSDNDEAFAWYYDLILDKLYTKLEKHIKDKK